ncbi:MAG: cyclic peptide export ABC transporter [Bacteroidota bacterium]
MKITVQLFITCWLSFLLCTGMTAQSIEALESWDKIDKEIEDLMSEGDIPGLSLVIIKDGQSYIQTYGYADLEAERPVDAKTLFELGSSSKAFSALAVGRLVQEGRLQLDDLVTEYLPWLELRHEGQVVPVSIGQLLHHTSGIPWHTISEIPESVADDALEQTVRLLVGSELDSRPGEEYAYATINYDVLALVVQEMTQRPFEQYLQDIIADIGMTQTSLGEPTVASSMAKGYRQGFFQPRPYEAPQYRGNWAAGYVISNAEDMAKWLRFQMGQVAEELHPLAEWSHERDASVPLHNMSAYAKGWNIALDGTGNIYHGGLNPNFTSYVIFRPEQQLGVAVMANSSSNFTYTIGYNAMEILNGEEPDRKYDPDSGIDSTLSMITIMLIAFVIVVLAFIGWVLRDIFRSQRRYEEVSLDKLIKLGTSVLYLAPFVFGVYLMPHALVDFSWEAIFVWMPSSLAPLLYTMGVGIVVTYVAYILSLLFPEKNQYKRMAPGILLMSVFLGISSVLVIVMVTSAIGTDIDLKYILFYYGLILSVYLLGRKFVQVNLIKFSNGLVYDLRLQIVNKIFSTSYQRFERIDRGRVYTTLNDDISTIGHITDVFVALVNSTITTVGAFVYLASIAFWATGVNVMILLILSVLILYVVSRARKYFELARDERNVFMRLINGMIDGFKEVSLHRNKKLEYRKDVEHTAREFRDKMTIADIKSFNSSIVGESTLVILLAFAAFVMPEMFPAIKDYKIMSFVMVLLYLIGPVNNILNSVPVLTNAYVSWNRVRQFIKEIPANMKLEEIPPAKVEKVHTLKAKDVMFKYKSEDQVSVFGVGPINLEIERGEIVFLIGGNGSGKTTLAKLLTGLYEADEGSLMINDKPISSTDLSEYFSTVFSPAHLFEKLYNVDIENKQDELKKYLKILGLEEKVAIEGNTYNTINLSAGQRKRLALLQCYLEDSPIFLFDEWAADQDPTYRRFFYRTLLPEIKKQGKIVIAITHDDHYFDVADKVLEMNMGTLKIHSHKSAMQVFSTIG